MKSPIHTDNWKKTQKIFCLFFNRNKQIQIFFFFLKQRSIVHVQVYFGLAEKSHDPVEGAGLEQAVFQLGLVMLKSFLSKLSDKLHVTTDTNKKFF